MQSLWARLLASEANQPGTFSKRTIEAVAALSKADAELFTLLCRFCCLIGGQSAPVIFDHNADFYRQCGIKFGVLKHLEDIGSHLLQFNRARLPAYPAALRNTVRWKPYLF